MGAAKIDPETIATLRSLQRPGRPDFLKQLIDTYIETSQEAWQALLEAHSNKNYQKLSEISHSLKSSSANLGALQLSEIFQKLEKLGAANENPDQIDSLVATANREYSAVLQELRQIQGSLPLQ